jgi:fluoride exporter
VTEAFETALAIAAGAILGANARYLVGQLAAARLGADFPYGTLFINVSGSLAIGFLLTLLIDRLAGAPVWRSFFATGFLGAYTTFSTYTYEAALLFRQGARLAALVYLLGSVAGGLVGVLAGIAMAERL